MMVTVSPLASPVAEADRSIFTIWPARIALVILVGWMCVSGYVLHPHRGDFDVSRWQNIDASRVTQIAHRLIVEWGWDLAAFVAVGLLTPYALGATVSTMHRWAMCGVVLLVGVAICGLVRGVQLAHFPMPGNVVLPLMTYSLGVWIGQTCQRGPRAVAWLAPKIGLALLMVGAGAAAAVWLALQSQPFDFEPVTVDKGSLRGLADKVRGSRGNPEEGRRIHLTAHEIDQLLASGLARVSAESKARVLINKGWADTEVSLALPQRGEQRKFANVRINGRASITDGHLSVMIRRLSIGRLAAPAALLRLVSPAIAATIRHDTDLRDLVGSIASLRLNDNGVDTVFKPGECSNTFVPALAHAISGRPKVTIQIREHVRHLLAGVGEMPPGDAQFVWLLRRAFAFARQRSTTGDPLIENRAALLALAILLGHERVETVVGSVMDAPQREQARRELGNITLRGRTDWTKHFLVSAAIALIACEGTSNKIGVLKEALDAEDGGSGFSFGDFAANRAGILLAGVSTFNDTAARATQDRLAGEFSVDDVFPEAADLPENLTAAEFQSRFGGIGGAEYLRMVAEIERRLSLCPALQ